VGGTWYQIVVTSFILLLVLIPYFAFRALGDVIGHTIIVRLFFEPRRTGIDNSGP
jgi:lauroyl/myristoyl acyltransferase